VNVSCGTGASGQSRTNGRKTAVIVPVVILIN